MSVPPVRTVRQARTAARRPVAPALLLTGAVAVLALPSAVLAFSTRLDVPAQGLGGTGVHHFAAADIDPRVAHALGVGKGPLFRFTPAGLVMRPDRAVTVAVRVDAATAREITVHGFVDRGNSNPLPGGSGVAALRIAPTAYNLGVARGYQGFAQSQSAPTLGLQPDLRRIEMPDLSTYRADSTPAGAPSRLAPHISLGERERPGRAPRTLESAGTQTVDLGGSYRVSRNIDVTAGVRYSTDRDRLQPIIDGKTDSQAVFVGTQFHF